MSVSKWAYKPEICDGKPCPGYCDFCSLWKEDEDDEEYEEEMDNERKEVVGYGK